MNAESKKVIGKMVLQCGGKAYAYRDGNHTLMLSPTRTGNGTCLGQWTMPQIGAYLNRTPDITEVNLNDEGFLDPKTKQAYNNPMDGKPLLTENSKMKDTNKFVFEHYGNKVRFYDWNMAPGLTCPMAGPQKPDGCLNFCYGFKLGKFYGDNLRQAWDRRFKEVSEHLDMWKKEMSQEVHNKYVRNYKKNFSTFIRIHSVGDFFGITEEEKAMIHNGSKANESYLDAWIQIMMENPMVHFYAYTKRVGLFKYYKETGQFPKNFTYVLSLGGKEDQLIDRDNDRHSIVLPRGSNIPYRYINGTNHDHFATQHNVKKIALIMH